MFKYTPPWQVLCNTLDHNFKRSTVTLNPNVASTQEHAVLSFHSTLRPLLPRSAQNPPPYRLPMTSNPKRWVIKPFSPKLEQLDLRSILSPTDQPQLLEKTWSSRQDSDSFKFSLEGTTVTGMQPTVMVSSGSGKSTPDAVVQAQQVAVSEDGSDSEDWRPSTTSNPSSPSSSTGSHVGFYSFVDDPACPEAELNEVYMVSPKRQAKLNTLKEKSTFKLQTYAEGKIPGRLFEETNGDDLYRVEDEAFTMDEKEENSNRMEIIRNQAPKKSPALKEQWSALEHLDLSNTPQRLLDGFSLLYKPVSAKTEQARVEPGTIDNEQIDFNTARKQFLIMEQLKQNLHHLPHSPKMQGQITSSNVSIFNPKDVSREISLEENQNLLSIQQKTEINTVTVTEDREDEVLSGNVDSVLGEQSGGYTDNGSISNDHSISEVENSLKSLSAEETPIQREIRISREREEDLRRSRGILRTDTLEMVEIRTKPILSQPSSQIKPAKAKETNRVSFFIQRELELEKQRQFPVPDHNSDNLALDKKALFKSHPQEIPSINLKQSQQESPTNYLEQRAVSADDIWITEQPVLVEEGDHSGTKEVLSPCCPHRHPDESMLQKNTDCMSVNKDQTGAYSEGNNYSKVRVYLENGVGSQTSNFRKQKKSSWIVENDNSMSRKNKLFSPTILSQVDLEKKSWNTPAWRSESSNWSPKLQNAPDSIRQEIEEDLRREQELQELRESLSEPTSAVTSVKTTSEPRSPVTSNEENVFLPESPHKHMEEVDSVPPEKKTDHSYPLSLNLSTSSVSRLSMTDKNPQFYSQQQNSRLPSMSIMIPQPWGNPKPMSPSVSRVTPIKSLSAPTDLSSPISQKGLTETLLKDFEDRRIKLKIEESAYAGIQPTDAINNEVVEATRVTRHKNQRALQWEAGMYANQDS